MPRRILLATALAAGALLAPASAQATSPDIVISEVYGGGGNSGAPLQNDFVELYNRGSTTVPLDNRSVQYASATGTGTFSQNVIAVLSGDIAAGQRVLIRAAGGSTGDPLPTPDFTGNVNMSATAGKVALVDQSAGLPCNGGSDPCTADESALIHDLVGYGSANFFETAPAPATSNTTSVSRKGGGTVETDNNANDFQAGAPTPRNRAGEGPGEQEPQPGTPARIHDIQGAGHRSPLVGRQVEVPGVVTAVSGNGFWMQDPEPDSDPATSEGIFVFRGADVEVGDSVVVTGPVSEFRPGGDANNLTTTEITAQKIDPGAAAGAIEPTLIGPGGLTPPTSVIEDDASDVETNGEFDPAQDGIDFHESLEGMLVKIESPHATGPRNGFGELSVVPEGFGGPFTPRGGIKITPEDFNPERLILDDTIPLSHGLDGMPEVNTGDGLKGPVEAVVDYSFGNFKYLVTSTPERIDNHLQREVTDAPRADQLAIASINLENLDPTDPPDKFARLASIVTDNLGSPDMLAVEEVQDNNGAAPGDTDASLTFQEFIAAIEAAGGPRYDYREIDPNNNTDGGEPNGNIRVGFLFRSDRGLEFVDRRRATADTPNEVVTTPGSVRLRYSPGRIDPTNPAFDDSRKPLAAEFTWKGRTVFAIANHFNSKGGDQPLFGRFQPPRRSSEVQRHQQATVLAGFVRQLLTADPRAAVAVMGDFNDFEFSETLDIVEGGGLANLMETLPANERYSYVFDGNSQVLDQILVSGALLTSAPEYDSVHVNAEFADQASDHDPQIARVVVPRNPR
jgi:predicted extracellular nuclease